MSTQVSQILILAPYEALLLITISCSCIYCVTLADPHCRINTSLSGPAHSVTQYQRGRKPDVSMVPLQRKRLIPQVLSNWPRIILLGRMHFAAGKLHQIMLVLGMG